MATKKRVTRKQLLKEPDEFMTTTGRVIRWVRNYRRPLTVAFGVLLVAGLLAAAASYIIQRRESQAFARLDQAIQSYQAALAGQNAQAAYRQVSKDFEQIDADYGGRQGGRMARLLWADIAYEAGEFEQAATLFESVRADFSSDPVLRDRILIGLGYAYQGQGDLKRAVASFETAAAASPLSAQALFNLGWLYTQTGQTEKSTDAYRQITENHADSIFAEIVKERLNEKTASG